MTKSDIESKTCGDLWLSPGGSYSCTRFSGHSGRHGERGWKAVWSNVEEEPDCDAAGWSLDSIRATGNLLAWIHRDGGHYVERHGWMKAIKDAERIAIRVQTVVREARTFVDRGYNCASDRAADIELEQSLRAAWARLRAALDALDAQEKADV